MQHPFGMIGSLIIEPAGAGWQTDSNSRASANVCKGPCTGGNVLFREFVLMVQDDNQGLGLSEQAGLFNVDPNAKPLPSTPVNYPALNYRTEPLDYRFAAADWLEQLGFQVAAWDRKSAFRLACRRGPTDSRVRRVQEHAPAVPHDSPRGTH